MESNEVCRRVYSDVVGGVRHSLDPRRLPDAEVRANRVQHGEVVRVEVSNGKVVELDIDRSTHKVLDDRRDADSHDCEVVSSVQEDQWRTYKEQQES